MTRTRSAIAYLTATTVMYECVGSKHCSSSTDALADVVPTSRPTRDRSRVQETRACDLCVRCQCGRGVCRGRLLVSLGSVVGGAGRDQTQANRTRPAGQGTIKGDTTDKTYTAIQNRHNPCCVSEVARRVRVWVKGRVCKPLVVGRQVTACRWAP